MNVKEARWVLEQGGYTCHTLLKNVQMSCHIINLLLARTLLAERIAIETFYSLARDNFCIGLIDFAFIFEKITKIRVYIYFSIYIVI